MSDATLRVRGYRELLRACDNAGKQTRKEVRGTFRKIGELVRVDARGRLAPLSVKSSRGYRTKVRQRGVSVEQTLGRTTGKRPDWGRLQMRRVLIPALHDHEDDVRRELDAALDKVAKRFSQP